MQVFGGVGIACLPLSLIFGYIRRPKAIITRSRYIKVQLRTTIYVFELQLSFPHFCRIWSNFLCGHIKKHSINYRAATKVSF